MSSFISNGLTDAVPQSPSLSDCIANQSGNEAAYPTKSARGLDIRPALREILRSLDPQFQGTGELQKPYSERSLLQATLEETILGVQEAVLSAIPGLVRQGFQNGLDRVFPPLSELESQQSSEVIG